MNDAGTRSDTSVSTVTPEDVRYEQLTKRGHPRWVGTPDRIHLPTDAGEVARVVDAAFREGKRLAVRGGGHCLEDFVDSSDVRVVVDLSAMTEVVYDWSIGAFAVGGGAILEDVYRELFHGWGVTIPAGWCPKVGVGGHVAGGGYGVLSRLHGLVVDHMYAVEVVVVIDGRARVIMATRESDDPHHDLWWAHTGGGGGCFGVVTRYFFRTPGRESDDPAQLLPTAPARMLDFTCHWPWEGLDKQRFSRLMRNHAEWCSRNAISGQANDRLYSELVFHRWEYGHHLMLGQAHGSDAEALLDAYVHEVGKGVGAPVNMVRTWAPFVTTAENGPNDTKKIRFKIKSAYLRAPFNEDQAFTIYEHLTRPTNPSLLIGSVGQSTYGGRINDVAPEATATATRDAIIKLTYVGAWTDPTADALNDAWVREFYRDVYAATGGVPDPADGAYIGYPDSDLADPALNTSGVPWSTLYFKSNYPRLQVIKARYDPHNVFQTPLSVRRDNVGQLATSSFGPASLPVM